MPEESELYHLLADLLRDDPALYAHGLYVWALTHRLGAYLLKDREEQTAVAVASLVHDIGKRSLPKVLFEKPMRLSPHEYAVMQQHCAAGAHLLWQRGIDDSVVKLVYHHHERWDGQGYPQGLAGSAIPRGSRLIAIMDAFAVMTTSRPYQPARPVSSALQELKRCAGTQFDPSLVQQCVAYLQTSQCISSEMTPVS